MSVLMRDPSQDTGRADPVKDSFVPRLTLRHMSAVDVHHLGDSTRDFSRLESWYFIISAGRVHLNARKMISLLLGMQPE